MGDVLKDSHPGSPTSLFSSMNNSESDSDFEVRQLPTPLAFFFPYFQSQMVTKFSIYQAGMNDINHPKKSGQADMPDYQFSHEGLCLLYLNVILYQTSIIFLNLFVC